MPAAILKPTLPARPGFLAVRPAVPPARPAPPTAPHALESFLPRLKGKVVRLELVNGREIVGILEAWARYELLVVTDDGTVVVQKGAIVTVREARP